MNLNELLISGANIQGGKGLHERKQDLNSDAKLITEDVITVATEEGIEEAADQFGLSLTAVSKYLARAIKKKDSDLCAETFIPSDKSNEIEAFIRGGNTTSIKRMVTAANRRFSEAEIRIVKADIESRGAESWDY